MAQLRRICREPPHINHISHSDFLWKFNVPDPLLRFRHQLEQAVQREAQRPLHLTDDDILHTVHPQDHEHLLQVIDEVYEQQRGQTQWQEVPDGEFQCHSCNKLFCTLAALRRHLTLEHGQRTGLLRGLSSTDIHKGVPTCQRCGAYFSPGSD